MFLNCFGKSIFILLFVCDKTIWIRKRLSGFAVFWAEVLAFKQYKNYFTVWDSIIAFNSFYCITRSCAIIFIKSKFFVFVISIHRSGVAFWNYADVRCADLINFIIIKTEFCLTNDHVIHTEIWYYLL